MDHLDDATQYKQFLCKQKPTFIDQFILSHLVNMQSFVKIHCKLMETWHLKPAIFFFT